jgi:signal peptidase II
MESRIVRGKLLLGAVLALAAAALVVADQWTKALAATSLAGRGTVRLLGDFAVLVYISNRGAFLSLGSGLPELLRNVFLIALPIGAIPFLVWALLKRGIGGAIGEVGDAAAKRVGRAEYASAVLIAAGGVGNLIDRIFRGEVRDFLNFGIGKLRTGIMNLADLYILLALIVIAASLVARSLRSRRAASGGAGTGADGSSDPGDGTSGEGRGAAE